MALKKLLICLLVLSAIGAFAYMRMQKKGS